VNVEHIIKTVVTFYIFVYLCLLNDSVSNILYGVRLEDSENCIGKDMEEHVLNWKPYLCTFLDRPWKATKNVIKYNRSIGRHSNRAPPEYKPEALPAETTCSFMWPHSKLISIMQTASPAFPFSVWSSNLYCKRYKICCSSLCKFLQCLSSSVQVFSSESFSQIPWT
jgi:hypothetical protein